MRNVEQEVEDDIEAALACIRSWRKHIPADIQLVNFKKIVPESWKKLMIEKYGEEGFDYVCAINIASINGHISQKSISYFFENYGIDSKGLNWNKN